MRINKSNEFTIVTAEKSSLVFVFVLYLQSQRCKQLEKIEFILESFFKWFLFFKFYATKPPKSMYRVTDLLPEQQVAASVLAV